MHLLLQENDELKKIPLSELQPDNRFMVDVNKIEGNINRKMSYLYLDHCWLYYIGKGLSCSYYTLARYTSAKLKIQNSSYKTVLSV